MAALDAAIHENTVASVNVLIQKAFIRANDQWRRRGGVDGRHKAGHDGTVRPIDNYRNESRFSA